MLDCLKERVFKGTISDKFKELSDTGSVPICLFPTCNAGAEFNLEMLMLLKEIAETIFDSSALELVDVHGFMYELHYVRTLRNVKSMALRDVEIIIDAVEDSTEIKKLPAGILYHLRYTYPVIDAIGYLKVNGNYYLVFVQLSLSEYRYHRTKMSDLTSVKAPEICKIPCIDEIDETMGTQRWNKRSAEQLQKLNKECNLTAGLEAELVIAVGARVMLRRNLNTKQGLVNDAIGMLQ